MYQTIRPKPLPLTAVRPLVITLSLLMASCAAVSPIARPTTQPTNVATHKQASDGPLIFTYRQDQVLEPDYLAVNDLGAAADDLIIAVNQARTERGLHALRPYPKLSRAAEDYARVLAAQGRLDHTGPDGSEPSQRAERAGYVWGFIGENLAAGQSSPRQTVQDWLKSKSHRDNMLDDTPSEAGAGFARASDHAQQDEQGNQIIRSDTYWVLLVGKPRG